MALAQAITPRAETVQVEQLTDGDEAAWDAFVLSHPDATFFHRAGWRRVIEGIYRHRCHYLTARVDGRIVGVLPLVHVKSLLFGSALISTGFCVYGGIAAESEEAVAALGDAAAALGDRLGVDYVELRSAAPAMPSWRTKSGVYATFKRTLSEDDDANLKAIPRKKRADVRKSLKNDLRVDTSAPVAQFHALYARSLRDLGTPVFSLRYAEAIVNTFPEDTEVAVVHGPDGPVAALLSFFFRDEVLPYYGGALPNARRLHAYDYLYWSLMGRAVARGACIFDFGRSKAGTGAYDYKTYWGFEPTPLHYQYHLVKADDVPDINPLNPKYRTMVRVWQRLPMPVANRLGPWVARQLG